MFYIKYGKIFMCENIIIQEDKIVMQSIIKILSDELKQQENAIEQVIKLLDEGNTVPFIAR